MTGLRASEMPTGDALGIIPHGSVEGTGLYLRAAWAIRDDYDLDKNTIDALKGAVGSATAARKMLDDGHAVEYILALGPWTGLPNDGRLPGIATASEVSGETATT